MYVPLLLRALATVAIAEAIPSSQSKILLEEMSTGSSTKMDHLFPIFTPPESPYDNPVSPLERLLTFGEGADLRYITALFEIPNFAKYLPTYLDWRDRSRTPFHSPLPYGPAPQDCKKHELIIARGAGELGDYGFIVGDPLLERVLRALPDTQGYAVQYPANVDGDPWTIGIQDVIHRLNTQSKKCPETKFALVGYSQGTHVIRKAVVSNETDPGVLNNKIVGGALFGDPWVGGKEKVRSVYPSWTDIPILPKALETKIINNCAVSWNRSDWFCDYSSQPYARGLNEFIGLISHFTYNNPGTKYIEDSAAHLVKMFQQS